jgi:low temperature requirement protein LtrA
MFAIQRLGHTEQRTSWLELFSDLVFVAAIAQLATQLTLNLTPQGVYTFMALFVAVWWCWSGSTNFYSRYHIPDGVNRLLTGLELLGVGIMGSSIAAAFKGPAFVVGYPFLLGYALVRGLLIAKYVVVAVQHPDLRPGLLRLCTGFVLGLAWMGLVVVWPQQAAAIMLTGVLLDLVGVLSNTGLLKTMVPNKAHLPERFGLFTLIVLGESIVGVVNSIQTQPLTLAAGCRGVVSLGIAYAIWWVYFDGLNDTVIRVAHMHQRLVALNSWILLHLTLFVGLTLLSVGVRLLIAQPMPLNTATLLWGASLTLWALAALQWLSVTCPVDRANLSIWARYALPPLWVTAMALGQATGWWSVTGSVALAGVLACLLLIIVWPWRAPTVGPYSVLPAAGLSASTPG